MITIRKALAATVIAGGVLMAGAAQASDALFGAVIGGGAGALIGQSMGGRDGAIVGGAIGAAAGAAAASSSQRYYGGVGVGYYPPAPVYRAPAPVYYAPPPVYYAPPPVYHVPAPVYYVSPPVVYRPAPVYIEYGGSRGHWKHKHGRGHDRQWQRGRDQRRGHYYR
jgi:hypothetical protein